MGAAKKRKPWEKPVAWEIPTTIGRDGKVGYVLTVCDSDLVNSHEDLVRKSALENARRMP